MRSIPFLSIFCLIFFILSSAALARSEVAIVAHIDDEIITDFDLKNRFNLLVRLSGVKIKNSAEKRIILSQLRDKMIEEKLQKNAALSAGIKVDKQKFAKAMVAFSNDVGIKRANNLNQLQQQVQIFMRNKGLCFSCFIDQLETQILWSQFLQQSLLPQIDVSQFEINEMLELRNVQKDIVKYFISEIFIPSGGSLSYQGKDISAKNLAQKIHEDIADGSDFVEYAKQFSRSPSASFGGEIGWVGKGDIAQSFYDKIIQSAVGESTSPISNKDGFYIFKISDKKTFNVLEEEDLSQIRNIILLKK